MASACGGTSPIRRRTPLGPYRRPMSRVLEGPGSTPWPLRRDVNSFSCYILSRSRRRNPHHAHEIAPDLEPPRLLSGCSSWCMQVLVAEAECIQVSSAPSSTSPSVHAMASASTCPFLFVVQGCLAHKKTPTPLGPLYAPRCSICPGCSRVLGGGYFL